MMPCLKEISLLTTFNQWTNKSMAAKLIHITSGGTVSMESVILKKCCCTIRLLIRPRALLIELLSNQVLHYLETALTYHQQQGENDIWHFVGDM